MKNLKVFFLLCLLSTTIFSCREKEKISDEETMPRKSNTQFFDESSAEKYGADEYGMKTYIFAFLKAGPNLDLDSTVTVQLKTEHLANIGRLAEEGKLVVAGPFLDDGDIRGIYIFNTDSIEEAEALTDSVMAGMAGSLTMELHAWYGSAALMAVNEIHAKISKKSFSDN